MLSEKIKNLMSLGITLKSAAPKKYNSPEEVRVALGFMPWDKYRKNIKQFAKNSDLPPKAINEIVSNDRRTGRTTEMLVKCLYHAQFEVVAIAGHPPGCGEDIVNQAKSMCLRLGIDPKNIVLAKNREDLRGVSHHFLDHSCVGSNRF